MDINKVEIAPTKWIAGIDVDRSLFAGKVGQEDLAFAEQALKDVERSVAAMLFKDYQYRRRKHGGRSANINLRKAVELIKDAQSVFGVPVNELTSSVAREKVASDHAAQCVAIVSNLTHGMTVPMNAVELLNAAMDPVRPWGFSPVIPDASKGVDDLFITMAVAAVARLQDAEWWERKITTEYERYAEYVKILSGFVRKGVSPYVSNEAAINFRTKKTAQAKWLAAMDVENEEQDLTLSLADAHASSVSNPEVRRVELMARMRGFEDLANQGGFAGEFYTWTAPSKHHPYTTRGNGKKAVKNRKYNGATPRDTQQYLCSQWAKVRAKLAREKIDVFGFRVVEPHADATPHWHMMLFVKPEQRNLLREIMEAYACEHDADELVSGTKVRFDYQAIDPTRGSATGYLAKYIAKNISGSAVTIGEDFEAETAADTTLNVAAWSSLWGIRQFQQIGGPAVSVWRELRRLQEAVGDPVIERTRAAARVGAWAEFVEAMGGVNLPRAERPVTMAHLIEEGASKYGEDVKKIVGVSRSEGAPVKTRLGGWRITRRQVSGSVSGSGERSELHYSGGSRLSWSSFLKCTESGLDSKTTQNLNRLGLDAVDHKRMQSGAVVVAADMYHWIRDNRLYQSGTRPRFHAPSRYKGPDYSNMDQDLGGSAESLTRHAFSVLAGESDLARFIDKADDPKAALMALDSALDIERKAAPMSYRGDPRLKAMTSFVSERLISLG